MRTSAGTIAASVLLILCALYGNAFLLVQAPLVSATAAIHQENNLLENAQLLLLLACLLTFALHAICSNSASARLIALAAVLLSFTFIVRESDLRPLGVAATVTWFSDGPGRYVLLTPAWAAWLWMTRHHLRPLQQRLQYLLFSAAGAAFACSVLLLLIGVLFDKGVFRFAPARYYEELCEFDAYLFMLLGALASGTQLQRAAPAGSRPA